MTTLPKTRDAARGHWRHILTHFGVSERYLEDKHGPCPMCQGKDRYRFDNRDGMGTYHCSGCGAGDGFKLLAEYRGWSVQQALQEVEKVIGWGNLKADPSRRPERSDADKKRILSDLWKGSRPLTLDSPAGVYLSSRCGNLTGLTEDLRAHPSLRYSRDDPAYYPGMLARLSYNDGRTASIHRTFLTQEGQKAKLDPVRKIMPGFPLEGSAVHMGPVGEVLGIAEGIETAICASHIFGIPVWAGISANGLESWTPPEGVRCVVICGDNDRNYTGQRAAYDLAKRLTLKMHMDVEVRIPDEVGTDWADVWSRSQIQGVA